MEKSTFSNFKQLGFSSFPITDQLESRLLACLRKLQTSSSTQVAVKCLEAGTWGAHKNVMININDVSDEAKKQELADKARKLMDTCEVMAPRILAILDQQ